MDDRNFGFYEFPESRKDAQFWLDHTPCRTVHHVFNVHPENARRQRSSFEGFVHVAERVFLEVRCQVYEVLYKQEHDVWCTGEGFVCGTHGQHCPAIDAVKYWLRTRHEMLIYYPRMTWDGRLFLAGACNVPGDEIFRLRFE